MRLFNGAVEAVKEVERDLWEMGHKNTTTSFQDKKGEYETKEIVGYSLTLINGEDWPKCFEALGMKDHEECFQYVLTEAKERWIAAPNPGRSYLHRPEIWHQFLEAGGKFSYTYGERIGDQLDRVLGILDHDKGSRQAVITIYNQEKDDYNRLGNRRVPCSMHYQVLVRKPNLYLIHSMRSCDLYTHFSIDMSIGWTLAKKFSEVLKFEGITGISPLKPHLIMQFGSFHAFRKDLEPRGIF